MLPGSNLTMESTPSDSDAVQDEELKVTFQPALYQQRRIWILNQLRKENITRVLDVGCGEGQLLEALCQPAPWLTPPPPTILPPPESPIAPNEHTPTSPVYNEDEVPNLHVVELHGLDVSVPDLEFAVEYTAPPKQDSDPTPYYRSYSSHVQRWEEIVAKIWKGGLEAINDAFVNIECIVSAEVIEHLPEEIFKTYTPMLLGVYHPQFFLVTTPSYTFNARFTAPDAPKSARKGFPDPTGRTDRIFRHSDHKFEWTRQEFKAWCKETAEEWGYEVQETSVGQAMETDLWGRDEELEGASSVAIFRRLNTMSNEERERKGRSRISELGINATPHELLAEHRHMAHPASMKPRPLEEIAKCVKDDMEQHREAYARLEQVWYEKDISAMCGGWIELLVRAVEQSPDLNLKMEIDGVKKGRSMWAVELIGGVTSPAQLWAEAEGDRSTDSVPSGWMPGEVQYDHMDDSDLESTGAEGDVSAWTSDVDADNESEGEEVTGWGKPMGWKPLEAERAWDEEAKTHWGSFDPTSHDWTDVPQSAMSSTAGWDGDESDDTTS